jgi:hypothetical protein
MSINSKLINARFDLKGKSPISIPFVLEIAEYCEKQSAIEELEKRTEDLILLRNRIMKESSDECSIDTFQKGMDYAKILLNDLINKQLDELSDLKVDEQK